MAHVLCIDFVLRGKEFTKFVSDVIATASARHTSRQVRISMPPARAIVRAVTATKHEAGFSPFCRVVSYGSAMEVWTLPTRLPSHYQRARSQLLAVVPLLRAALTRWFLVAISAAAAKLCFSLCSTASIQDSDFCNLENLGALGHDSSLFAVTRQQWRGVFAECYVPGSPAYCRPPHWVPILLQELSQC